MLNALFSLISNEHEFLGFLQFYGLLLNRKKCIKCKRECGIYKRNRKYFFQCNKKKCRKQYTAIPKNSFLSNARLNMTVIVQLIFCFINDMTSTQIKKMLGLSASTVSDWLNFFREVCEVAIMNSSEKLGGEGKIVEIDESVFGKRKYNKGRMVKSRWVIGGIERGTGKCFLVPVSNRNSETIMNVIQMYINPGTTIITDEWKGYNKLCKENYTHLTVNHSINFVNAETGAHTNTIEGEWSKVSVKKK